MERGDLRSPSAWESGACATSPGLGVGGRAPAKRSGRGEGWKACEAQESRPAHGSPAPPPTQPLPGVANSAARRSGLCLGEIANSAASSVVNLPSAKESGAGATSPALGVRGRAPAKRSPSAQAERSARRPNALPLTSPTQSRQTKSLANMLDLELVTRNRNAPQPRRGTIANAAAQRAANAAGLRPLITWPRGDGAGSRGRLGPGAPHQAPSLTPLALALALAFADRRRAAALSPRGRGRPNARLPRRVCLAAPRESH